ncbi:alpha/beta hydrolase [Romboutsia sp. 1001216sp1]|uniref:alpha/beta hydrolase n=1 Tax=Romboutsia TaxID=1501226 RepID=UPI000AC3B159|nr:MULTISPECIES: alpha/beta hydrolase [Romboutsia]MDB8792424.1 alpha/beta hydrolase [Romboutsia sp. 1001216sp1]MDB8795719.1 alpha/beta hydrolase [Romboutsia sp. 1001216sp1]MDB8798402.1 alpha/beta hydrolase [Romboutsia sp. 1001216sp1]
MGKDRKERISDDTFSITMELERPLIIDQINKHTEQKEKELRRKNIKRKILITISIMLGISLLGFFIWIGNTYEPGTLAKEALISDKKVEVKIDKNIVFTPKNKDVTKGFIFYPGAKINPEAYAPICKEISEAGYEVVILKMPLNIAFLGENEASKVMKEYKNITHWVVGGHSLGGVVASSFAAENNLVDGVVLLSSYPMTDKLKNMTKDVLSIWGSKDGVVNFESLIDSKKDLPNNTTYVEIEGANHSYFGDYGLQNGDNEALISEKEQINKTAKSIIKFLKEIN